jgi:hypothetical protein
MANYRQDDPEYVKPLTPTEQARVDARPPKGSWNPFTKQKQMADAIRRIDRIDRAIEDMQK